MENPFEEFDKTWAKDKKELLRMREERAVSKAELFVSAAEKILSPFKVKEGRYLQVRFGMGCVSLELCFEGNDMQSWDGEGLPFRRCGTEKYSLSLYRHKEDPFCAALIKICKKAGDLNSEEDDVVLSALDGMDIRFNKR